MTEKHFFQISAGLPLLLPVVFFPVAVLAHHMDLPFAEGLVDVAAILTMSVFLGGVPYLVFGGVVLWFLWQKPAKTYRWFSLVAPVIYSVFLYVAALLVPWGPSWVLGDISAAAPYLAAWGLGLGYVYVLIVHLLMWIFRCRGAFETRTS